MSVIEATRVQVGTRSHAQWGAMVMDPESGHRPERHLPVGTVILLVDDDPLVQEAVGSMLAHLGLRPVLAGTGEEALALLSGGLDPRLVILDMDMPGWGGAGTLPRLRALRPSLPVLISTGRMHGAIQDLIRDHPAVGLMPKPFDLEGLRRHLASALPEIPGAEGAGPLPTP